MPKSSGSWLRLSPLLSVELRLREGESLLESAGLLDLSIIKLDLLFSWPFGSRDRFKAPLSALELGTNVGEAIEDCGSETAAGRP